MRDLDPELDQLRQASAAAGLPPMTTLTPAEARARVAGGHRLCAAGPDVPVRDEVVAGSVPVRIYSGRSPRAVLVYAHGGGWVTGDLDYSDELCRFVADEAGCVVVSVDYRLAPEHPFPAALDDVAAAVSWARSAFPGLPVGIGGDSAGGNLAAVVSQDLRDRLAFCVLVYPVVDHDLTTHSYRSNTFPIGRAEMEWFFDHYVPPDRRSDPRVSPLRAADLSGLPPTLVVLAGHDPLHDEGAAYATALAQTGVPVTVTDHPRLCHGFLRFTGASAAARDARDHLVTSIDGLISTMAKDPASREVV